MRFGKRPDSGPGLCIEHGAAQDQRLSPKQQPPRCRRAATPGANNCVYPRNAKIVGILSSGSSKGRAKLKAMATRRQRLLQAAMLSGIRATRTWLVRVEMSDGALGGVRHPQFPQKSHLARKQEEGDSTGQRTVGEESGRSIGALAYCPHLAAGRS